MADCLFCKIVAGEIPSQKVYEDENVLAIRDINPQAPIHVLLLPKKHIASLNEAQEPDRELLSDLMLAIPKVAEAEGIREKGYRVILNNGKNAGQLVPHLHFHILGGKHLGPKIVA